MGGNPTPQGYDFTEDDNTTTGYDFTEDDNTTTGYDFTEEEAEQPTEASSIKLPTAGELDDLLARALRDRQELMEALKKMRTHHDWVATEQAIYRFIRQQSAGALVTLRLGNFYCTEQNKQLRAKAVRAFKETATQEEIELLNRSIRLEKAARALNNLYGKDMENALLGLKIDEILSASYLMFVFTENLKDFPLDASKLAAIFEDYYLVHSHARIKGNSGDALVNKILHFKPSLTKYVWPNKFNRSKSECVNAWKQAASDYFRSSSNYYNLANYMYLEGVRGQANYLLSLDKFTQKFSKISSVVDDKCRTHIDKLNYVASVILNKAYAECTAFREFRPIVAADEEILQWAIQILIETEKELKNYTDGDAGSEEPYNLMFYSGELKDSLSRAGLNVSFGDPRKEGTKYFELLKLVREELNKDVEYMIKEWVLGEQ